MQFTDAPAVRKASRPASERKLPDWPVPLRKAVVPDDGLDFTTHPLREEHLPPETFEFRAEVLSRTTLLCDCTVIMNAAENLRQLLEAMLRRNDMSTFARAFAAAGLGDEITRDEARAAHVILMNAEMLRATVRLSLDSLLEVHMGGVELNDQEPEPVPAVVKPR